MEKIPQTEEETEAEEETEEPSPLGTQIEFFSGMNQ
jgi:hypothetical protein